MTRKRGTSSGSDLEARVELRHSKDTPRQGFRNP